MKSFVLILFLLLPARSLFASTEIFSKKLKALGTCSKAAKTLGEELQSLQTFTLNKSQSLNRDNFQKALDEENISGEFYRILAPYAYTPFINDVTLNACYTSFKAILDELKKSNKKGALYRFNEWDNCYQSAFKLTESPLLIKTIGKCLKDLK